MFRTWTSTRSQWLNLRPSLRPGSPRGPTSSGGAPAVGAAIAVCRRGEARRAGGSYGRWAVAILMIITCAFGASAGSTAGPELAAPGARMGPESGCTVHHYHPVLPGAEYEYGAGGYEGFDLLKDAEEEEEALGAGRDQEQIGDVPTTAAARCRLGYVTARVARMAEGITAICPVLLCAHVRADPPIVPRWPPPRDAVLDEGWQGNSNRRQRQLIQGAGDTARRGSGALWNAPCCRASHSAEWLSTAVADYGLGEADCSPTPATAPNQVVRLTPSPDAGGTSQDRGQGLRNDRRGQEQEEEQEGHRSIGNVYTQGGGGPTCTRHYQHERGDGRALDAELGRIERQGAEARRV